MRDWQWAEVDGQPLTLDAWWPGGAGPWPMVVWVHGADPDGGCKELGNYTARRIASHGYVVLSINYRAAPAHPFPAAVEDCLGAVVWAKREAARFNGNPARVAIAGESAGGSLAALAAYAADRDRFHPTGARPGDPDPFVRAVVSVGGLFDFAAVAEDGVRNAEPPTHTLAESRVDGSARGAAASPRTWLDPHDPPTLLICGSADPFFKQSIALKKALVHNRVDHEFFSPEQTGCGFLVWEWDSNASRDAVRRMVAFLDRVLK